MSVLLIKDLKMPDCCWNCPCFEGEYGKCNIFRISIRSGKGRLDDCPLIELSDQQTITASEQVRYICPHCDSIIYIDEIKEVSGVKWCPNCGQKMERF